MVPPAAFLNATRRVLAAFAALMPTLGLVWMLALAWAAPTTGWARSAVIEPIYQAKVLVGNDTTIPDMALQGSTPLPDDWAVSRPRTSGTAWYRVAFETPAAAGRDELLALYIKRVCSNVEVHLNSRHIFGSGRTDEPATRNCPYPQLVTLPAALLRDDGNVLDLRVQGSGLHRVAAVQRAAGLSELKIGPLDQLAEEHATRLFWSVTAVQIASGALFVLGCVMLVLGWATRRETHEWVLGWLLLGWSVMSLRLWLRDTPLDNALVEFVASSGLSVLAALAVVFLLRYARWTFRPLEFFLLFQCLLMPMTMLLGGPNRLHLMSSVWSFLLSIEVCVAMGLYLALSWPQRRADFWALVPVLVLVVGLLLVELAVQRHVVEMPAVDITHLGLSLALIFVGLRVLVQFPSASDARQRRQAEATDKKALETRLTELSARHETTLAELTALRAEAQKAQERKRAAPAIATEFNAETERNLAHLAELRVEQVTAQERKRIAADLHDDLGAKLLTIVHTSESDQISTLAREALEEMRLSVRGLSGKPMRLADAVADWRAETVARLSQANIEIDWRGLAEETDQRLAARSFVQTTRILREAISNIIKHSGASQCKVRCGIREKEFGLVVQDNGNGISMELDGQLDRGHGMASMKNRAKQMQGQCLVESGPGYGTVIRLTLPL
jgi:two-component system, NarL family, sensor histidine kinase UhpB